MCHIRIRLHYAQSKINARKLISDINQQSAPQENVHVYSLTISYLNDHLNELL